MPSIFPSSSQNHPAASWVAEVARPQRVERPQGIAGAVLLAGRSRSAGCRFDVHPRWASIRGYLSDQLSNFAPPGLGNLGRGAGVALSVNRRTPGERGRRGDPRRPSARSGGSRGKPRGAGSTLQWDGSRLPRSPSCRVPPFESHTGL